jgi:hypothetical protein
LITAVLTLLILAKVTPFSQPVPDIADENKRPLERVMIRLRDTAALPFVDEDDKLSHSRSFVMNGGLAFLLLCTIKRFRLFPALKAIFTGETHDFSGFRLEAIFLNTTGGFSFPVALFGSIWLSLPGAKRSFNLMKRQWQPENRGCRECAVLFSPLAVFLLSPLTAVLVWLPVSFLTGFIPAITISVMGFGEIRTEISQLAAWPTNIACPQHWIDPMANWVWMLA